MSVQASPEAEMYAKAAAAETRAAEAIPRYVFTALLRSWGMTTLGQPLCRGLDWMFVEWRESTDDEKFKENEK